MLKQVQMTESLTKNQEPGRVASERRTALFWDGSLQRSVDSPLLSVQRLFSREAELTARSATVLMFCINFVFRLFLPLLAVTGLCEANTDCTKCDWTTLAEWL